MPGGIAAKNATGFVGPHGPALDGWMLFGFCTAVVLLTSLTADPRTRAVYVLRACCLVGLGAYGFAQGVWPLGLVLAAEAVVNLHRFRRQRLAPHLLRERKQLSQRKSTWKDFSWDQAQDEARDKGWHTDEQSGAGLN